MKGTIKEQIFMFVNTGDDLVDPLTFKKLKQKLEVNKQRKHHCEYCGLSFKRKEHLSRHKRTHTGEKPFSCPFEYCQKRFPRKDNLKLHLKTVHLHTNGDSISSFTTEATTFLPTNISTEDHLLTSALVTPPPTTTITTKTKNKNKTKQNKTKQNKTKQNTKHKHKHKKHEIKYSATNEGWLQNGLSEINNHTQILI